VPKAQVVRGLVSAAAAAAAFTMVAPAAMGSMHQGSVASETPSTKTPHAIDDAAVANAHVDTFSQDDQTMYAGGLFNTVQSPDRTISYQRNNLFSFNVDTGQVSSWAPNINGLVFRTLVVGDHLYVGGSFTSADGVSGRLVRYDISGAQPIIDKTWKAAGINGGKVTDLELVSGRLIVSGTFPKKLIALNPATGQDTGYINLTITGSVATNAGSTEVYRFAVNPTGTRLVAIGNFTAVAGQTRWRAFMVNLGSTTARLSSWHYAPLQKMCRADSIPDYLRDVDFSPDGTYFVMVSTGYVPRLGGIGTDVCDAAARFETSVLAPAKPTWINYTGGDTLHSVAAVGSAVYVGGHQRWLDNPYGRDSAGAGAVSRPGVGAINSDTGKALAWNPTKSRAVGLKFIYPTVTGVWYGSDGRHFNEQVHDSIAFTPLS
jgi:hypothetical protein